MRTTINLPDDLMAQIKKLAAASHSTVTALIEDTLREGLARRRRSRRSGRVILPTYGKKGPLPGVDIDDTACLLDVMESSVDTARR
ncbi:MAG: ribbon-helix-helix domain-containing protein [Nitrospira sp.]|nr:ribbon-helix-helix domain-containing protein [Nitrospira sp.]MDH4371240.1 ribbon-helix-helix domain-containing protein [Nitrospira sp.]MDH5348322.1 ribbon-helix-helix domain-containing protein [Nitrospira sp.]MDH5498777.1 ribbon-helix-helix domain-containing protein [Nitrospira sp.]MDH5726055.1 ribbon-helix-helix domain-containing protein [Nitrospira sp.]